MGRRSSNRSASYQMRLTSLLDGRYQGKYGLDHGRDSRPPLASWRRSAQSGCSLLVMKVGSPSAGTDGANGPNGVSGMVSMIPSSSLVERPAQQTLHMTSSVTGTAGPSAGTRGIAISRTPEACAPY